MKRLFSALTAVAVLAFTSLTVAPARPLHAAEIVPPSGKVLEIEIRKGTLVRLGSPVATVFIADPGIADIQVKSPTLIYLFGLAVGETTLYGVDENDQVLVSAGIRVNHNLGRLRGALQRMLPDAQIDVESLDGALVLKGAVYNPTEAEDARRLAAAFTNDKSIINRIAVEGPNQVNLRVRMAEVSREVVKDLGINWEAVFDTGDFLFGMATGRDIAVFGSGAVTRAADSDTFFGTVNTSDVDVTTIIDALESEGFISILAEPNLTALSGETASFLAGGEFPIPVAEDDDAIRVEFKEFGVKLAFTPTLIGNDRISLKVAPEVSQLTTAGAVTIGTLEIPALATRRAETTVELGSGQTFAIAGLLQRDFNQNLSKTPGLGTLPIIGPLFRSHGFQQNETELVILVTPYIVTPVSSQRMAMPTDGYVAPSDVGRYLLGQNYRPQLREESTGMVGNNGQRLIGPAGFALD